MPRALWKGAVSFGLIYVPVELHTASKENTLPLHMLDRRDFAPIGFHRINKITGKEVGWSDIVKGYEYKKGDYVALSDADFKHANVKASETIDIDTFCDGSQIPAMYYEKPYYLAPTKGGDKVYSLLRQALEATDKVAVATFVMHQREHLCVIAPQGSSLMLLTLRFADEVLPAAHASTAKISSAELAMAKQLVESLSSGPQTACAGEDSTQGNALPCRRRTRRERAPKGASHRSHGGAQSELEEAGTRRRPGRRAQVR
jgi:DNA end-binding protein Ku